MTVPDGVLPEAGDGVFVAVCCGTAVAVGDPVRGVAAAVVGAAVAVGATVFVGVDWVVGAADWVAVAVGVEELQAAAPPRRMANKAKAAHRAQTARVSISLIVHLCTLAVLLADRLAIL